VDLKAKIPVDTSVGLRVRVALDATAFSGANQAPWYPDLVAGKPAYINVPSTNPSGFATYSIPIIGVDTALNVRARRFLQIEYKLATNSDQASPVLDASTVVWSPPDPK
jgi:hypothetical protein